jgi:hypothetical protein
MFVTSSNGKKRLIGEEELSGRRKKQERLLRRLTGGRNGYNGQKTAVFGSGPVLGLIPLVV